MSKYDARGFKLISWKMMGIIAVVELAMFIYWGFQIGGLIVPFAMFGGWQLGCTSERNDWDSWYKKQVSPSDSLSRIEENDE